MKNSRNLQLHDAHPAYNSNAEHRKPLLFTAANKKAISSGYYYTSSRVLGVST
jgi:hypothetical protein